MGIWTAVFLFGITVWSGTIHPSLADAICIFHYQRITTGREDPGTQDLFENIPSPIACAIHAVTNSKGGYAYYHYKRLCLTASFSSPEQHLDNNRTFYRSTQFSILEAGQSKIQAQEPIDQMPLGHGNGTKSAKRVSRTNHSAKQPPRKAKQSRRGFFWNRNHFIRKGLSRPCRLEDSQPNPNRMAFLIRNSDIALVTTGGYIIYLNTKLQDVEYKTRVLCRDVISVGYYPSANTFWLSTQSRLTYINMMTGIQRSEGIRSKYALKTIADPANNMILTLRPSSIEVERSDRRFGRHKTGSIPVEYPLDVIIDPQKRCFLWSCVINGAITIAVSPYFGSGVGYLETNMKTLYSFQAERTSGMILLCSSEGVFEAPILIKEFRSCPCERLTRGACLAIKEWNNILFALIYMNDLKQTAVYQLNSNSQIQKSLVPLTPLPNDAGKWEIQPLFNNLMANQEPSQSDLRGPLDRTRTEHWGEQPSPIDISMNTHNRNTASFLRGSRTTRRSGHTRRVSSIGHRTRNKHRG